MLDDPIVIVGSKRTPLGGFQGVFSDISATVLGAMAIQGALTQSHVAPQDIGSVFMGCVLSAGLGQSPARQASLQAGLPYETTTTLVNKVCGSALQAIASGVAELRSEGPGSVTVAGGMESMTRAPYLLPQAREGYRWGHHQLRDHLLYDGLEDAYTHQVMGKFAEETARKYQLTREVQDQYAYDAATRTLTAMNEGTFDTEIIPVKTKTEEVRQDEPPSRIKRDKISHLKPAFDPEGTVTAATSSGLADGAAAFVLTHLSTAQKKGLEPLASIRGVATHAQEPEWFTTAPIQAISKLASKVGWLLADVDLFEVNEAFAVVPLAVMKALTIPAAKMNIFGGACALGHPLGASGARILVTLLNALQHHNLKRGIAALCIGGGEAISIAIERL